MTGTRLAQLADELRALAANGIHYHLNEHDLGRYQRIQAIAAELLAQVDSRDVAEIERVFRGDLGPRTPLVAADAAAFDPSGRLLIVRRADSGLWCMPGGACDVGERPSHAAEREAFEESGFTVRATRLLGAYDNRAWPGDVHPSAEPAEPAEPATTQAEPALHFYHLVFACELVGGEATVSVETSEVRWVTPEEAKRLPLYRNHVRKIPAAFRLYGEPDAPAEFD